MRAGVGSSVVGSFLLGLYIKQNITKAHFFVFTNDVEYAQNILSSMPETVFDTIIFISNKEFENDPGFDLFLMSQCKHNIIANSTYSWWGAFLNENTDKIVACPVKLVDKLNFLLYNI